MITNAKVVIQNNAITITKGKVRVRIAPIIGGLVVSGYTNTAPTTKRLWERKFYGKEVEEYREENPEKLMYPGEGWTHG